MLDFITKRRRGNLISALTNETKDSKIISMNSSGQITGRSTIIFIKSAKWIDLVTIFLEISQICFLVKFRNPWNGRAE